jgi:hypothetical protein
LLSVGNSHGDPGAAWPTRMEVIRSAAPVCAATTAAPVAKIPGHAMDLAHVFCAAFVVPACVARRGLGDDTGRTLYFPFGMRAPVPCNCSGSNSGTGTPTPLHQGLKGQRSSNLPHPSVSQLQQPGGEDTRSASKCEMAGFIGTEKRYLVGIRSVHAIISASD